MREGVEVGSFGGNEEHSGGVFTGSDAGTTADALSGVHSGI